MDKRLHIVLVTTWYPPRHGIAVNRMIGFARYIDPLKFHLRVITIGNGDVDEDANGLIVYREKNESLLSVVHTHPGESRLTHTLKVIWNTVFHFLHPMEYAGWRKNVVRQLNEIHLSNPIDAIISSYSPVEAHLAAADFLNNHPSVLWVADMRDEMSGNVDISERTRKMLLKAEKTINKRADLVTTVSKPILDDFRKLLPDVKRFGEIRNGFDHEIEAQKNHNEVFTISYAGIFYGAIKPHTFFKGLIRFLEKNNVQISIQFIGTHHNFDIPDSVKDLCIFIPQLPNSEAVKLIAASDANLLILPQTGRKGVFSGKIFDYISVQKPIIALADPLDVAAQLITEHNAGFIAGFNEIPAIERAISSAYDLWKNRLFLNMDPRKVTLLHRKFQVKKLENLILQSARS